MKKIFYIIVAMMVLGVVSVFASNPFPYLSNLYSFEDSMNDTISGVTGQSYDISYSDTAMSGKSINFSKPDNCIVLPSNLTNYFPQTENITFVMWLKLRNESGVESSTLLDFNRDYNSGGLVGTIIYFNQPNGDATNIGYWDAPANYNQLYFSNGSVVQDLLSDEWYMFAFSYSVNGRNIYKNNIIIANDSFQLNITDYSPINDWIFGDYKEWCGASTHELYSLNGFMDELMIFSKELNQSEIDYLYNGGAGNFYSELPICDENWTANYYNESCNGTFINEIKYYIDQNSCNTTLNLPIDNGTISNIYPCTIPSQKDLMDDNDTSNIVAFGVTLLILFLIAIALIPKEWLKGVGEEAINTVIIIVLIIIGLVVTLNLFFHFIG